MIYNRPYAGHDERYRNFVLEQVLERLGATRRAQQPEIQLAEDGTEHL
jgi:hypothetical protein